MAASSGPDNGERRDERPRYGWFGPLLVSSWRLWKPNLRSVSVAFFALVAILSLALPAVGFFFRDSSVESSVALSLVLVTFLGIPFFGGLLAAHVSRLVRDRLGGRAVGFKDVRVALRPNRSHILAAAMLATFLTFAFAYALPPLGQLIGPFLFLGPPILIQVIALEGRSFSSAWNRTKELMRGETVRVLVYLLCISLTLGLVVILIVGVTAQALAESDTNEAVSVGLVLLQSVIAGVAFGFMACVAVSTYFELRARKEQGFDATAIEEEPNESEA